jgi:hypothetical protein
VRGGGGVIERSLPECETRYRITNQVHENGGLSFLETFISEISKTTKVIKLQVKGEPHITREAGLLTILEYKKRAAYPRWYAKTS